MPRSKVTRSRRSMDDSTHWPADDGDRRFDKIIWS
jgi:hypothetical protein